jgi:hypothetical protein
MLRLDVGEPEEALEAAVAPIATASGLRMGVEMGVTVVVTSSLMYELFD